MRCLPSNPRVTITRAVLLSTTLSGCLGAGLTPIADGSLPEAADDAGDVTLDASADTLDASIDTPLDAQPDVRLPPTPLTVQPVRWNSAGADLGMVTAVAEPESLIALFGQRGLQVLAGGSVAATDNAVTAWSTAALVPSGDGTATPWALGVAADGRIWRVRDRSRLEEVTARYALSMRRVRSLASLSGNRVAFGYEGGFAVADGTRVSLWSDPAFAELVGAAGRLAASTAAGVRVFDVAANMTMMYALPGVTSVTFDADDRLVVAAGNDLYVESASGSLVPRVVDGAALRSAVRSADRVWVIAGTQLALWDGRELHPSPDVRIAAGARLLPSPSGDVWVLTGGALSRYGFVVSPEIRQWEDTVRPVFAQRCVPCHLPGGTGNLDLSVYDAWVMRRADIRTQVVTRRTMPPPPATLTTNERAAITQWLDADGGVRDASTDAPRTDASVDVRDASLDTRG